MPSAAHLRAAVDHHRLARRRHRAHGPSGRGGAGGSVEPHAVLVLRRGSAAGCVAGSYQRMPMSPVSKHLAQLVADEVDDRLEVELRGHALLDAVDDRELGGALLGFLEQALRLVEEARVLQRDAHATRRRSSAGGRRTRRTRSRARSSRCRSSPSTRSLPTIGTRSDRLARVGAGHGRQAHARSAPPAVDDDGCRVRAHRLTDAARARRLGGMVRRFPCSYTYR